MGEVVGRLSVGGESGTFAYVSASELGGGVDVGRREFREIGRVNDGGRTRWKLTLAPKQLGCSDSSIKRSESRSIPDAAPL